MVNTHVPCGFLWGNLPILTGAQEGTVPHRDKSARIPWPLREYKCASCSCVYNGGYEDEGRERGTRARVPSGV
eukprot:1637931-Prymnesium_polylepis.1